MCVAEYVSSRLHPTINVTSYKGFADQVLLRAYTCVLQKSGLHPGVEILPGKHRPTAAVTIHTHGLQNESLEGCTEGSRVTKIRPTDCFINMRVAKHIKSGLRPRVEMFQGFGRPGAAASIHMCAAV